jgi:hypothetical protein
LGNAQIKVETLWAHCPLDPANRKQGDPPEPISRCVFTYFRHFLSISSKHGGFIKPKKKSETQQKNVKTPSGSSPIFALSNDTAFFQTQPGATVPFKG